LIHRLLEQMQRPPDLIRHVTDRPGHDRRYALDASLLRRELGWAPRVSLEQGLAETIAWYRDHAGWVARVRSGEYRQFYETQYGARLREDS
jgi:dTDP-glucose 4,6-dehydratase